MDEKKDQTTTTNPPEAAPQQSMSAEEAAKLFDLTRKARQESCKEVERFLQKAAQGHKLDRGETGKIFKNLLIALRLLDETVIKMMSDMVLIIRNAAEVEAQMTQESAMLATLNLALQEKGLVSNEDLNRIHKEKIVPELKERLEKLREEIKEED